MKRLSVFNKTEHVGQFNMTSMIDIVFLLIIFFMLICQFIVQENYTIEVPDEITQAYTPDAIDASAITLSVYRNPDNKGHILYAVKAKRYDPQSTQYRKEPPSLFYDMAQEIKTIRRKKQTGLIHLRADKSIAYHYVHKAMIALSQAGIPSVQIAALKNKQQQ
jgi:biopolymer transport protein ExbD